MEARLDLAVKAILDSPLDSNGEHKLKIHAAGCLYDVKCGTLMACLNGVKSQKEVHAHECALSEAKEDVLTDWAKTLGHRGFPITQDMLAEYALASFCP